MNLKMLTNKHIHFNSGIWLEKDKTYEIDAEQSIVGNDWKIKVPMKQKGKFRYAF